MLVLALVAFYGATSIASFKISFNTSLGNIEIGHDFRHFREVQAYGIAQAIMTDELEQGSEAEKKHPNLVTSGNKPVQIPSAAKAPPAPASDDDPPYDPDIFAKRAVQFWVQKEYLKLYEQYGLTVSPMEITKAEATFNKFKFDSFQSTGKTGVIVNLAVDKLKAVIDLWLKADLITNTDADTLKLTLDGDQSQQDAKDIGHTRGNGDLLFGRVGFISLQVKKSDPRSGTLVYMFRKFHFNLALDVKVEKKQKCYVWGLFCETEVKVQSSAHDLTGEESTNLGVYMKWQVGKDYDETNGPYIRYLGKEADRYSQFLPAKFKGDWDKIGTEPEKDPSEVVEKNALDPKNYEL